MLADQTLASQVTSKEVERSERPVESTVLSVVAFPSISPVDFLGTYVVGSQRVQTDTSCLQILQGLAKYIRPAGVRVFFVELLSCE